MSTKRPSVSKVGTSSLQPPRKKLNLSLSRSRSCPDRRAVDSSKVLTSRPRAFTGPGITNMEQSRVPAAACIVVDDDYDDDDGRDDGRSVESHARMEVDDLLKCPFCPSCQMPLVGRANAWSSRHIQDCLDFPSKPSEECPHGAQCTFSLPNHFRKYRHLALAARRCNATVGDSTAASANSTVLTGMHPAFPGPNDAIEVIGPLPQSSGSKENSSHAQAAGKQKAAAGSNRADTDRLANAKPSLSPSKASSSSSKDLQQGTLASFFGLKIPPPPVQGPPSPSSTVQPRQQQPWGGLMSRSTRTQSSATSQSSSRTPGTGQDARQGHGAAGQDETDGAVASAPGGRPRKQCPFFKKIPDTCFTVDAFCYGTVEGCKAYFLTHFHSDHYQGLSKSFSHTIYCSQSTGNLCISQLRVKPECIHCLKMYEPTNVQGVLVTLVDANHCPGSVMFIFQLSNGKVILHTGDFRSGDSVIQDPHLRGMRYDSIYLDTTYLDPKYDFPPQEACVQFAVRKAREAVAANPKTLVVSGTYSIGKERIFLAVAEALKSKVAVTAKKKAILEQLEWPELTSRLTTDWSEAQVHVLSMMQISFKGMKAHLQDHGSGFSTILGFRPTGWTQNNKSSIHGTGSAMPDILPSFQDGIIIYGIPYSEHSSFSELKRFVQHFRPRSILPTVNMGSASSRERMQTYFRQWMPS